MHCISFLISQPFFPYQPFWQLANIAVSLILHCKIKHWKKIPKISQKKLLPKFRNFFPLFYNRLHFMTFGILFQFDRNLLPAVNSQHSEFSYPVKRIKFPNFGIKFRTIQKILVFRIFFRNYTNSLVAQTEQNFTIRNLLLLE